VRRSQGAGRYRQAMTRWERLLLACACLLVMLPAEAPAAPAAKGRLTSATVHALLSSKELWATIDVCNAADQPNTVGVRGSMPGDGQARDRMYMSFRLQYLNKKSGHWVDLTSGATPDYAAVGGGMSSSRQGGSSFALVPVAGKPAFTLRGVVTFQWRRGHVVIVSTSRPTTAPHASLAGADPAGYSAATCLIG